MTANLLSRDSLLHFSGSDAQAFLHGQLTCDVLALESGFSTYGGYCTPKGRLLATFLLWRSGADYFMLLPGAVAEPIRKRLTMYILRAKVKAEDITATQACIGVAGTDSAQQIAALGGKVPDRLHTLTANEDVTVIAIPVQRYLVVLPRERATAVADPDAWTALDIEAGIPFITPPTQEEFVAQMVNLDLIGGLSYTKGCYPGQEIVARTHYLGRLKQRMYCARINASATAGDKLYCDALGDQSSGMIVAAAPDKNGPCDVLAVLQTAHAGSTPYHLGSLQGPVLELGSLPYAVN
ncbi:MAG: folate-binding protein [Betaproteobacteria bacterium]|nr:folate-binding protein [Betaproteobacteria bacterium]MDH4292966.1 folate-binding protein [Betaproteobacteria bacterium]MDH5342892.1 folate-binding protein [Betaproteobacteria bacterium]